ncbi:unknown [Gryllus bimaculatus nudivirus]|uniref:Uncharacterized protein n=1 Tax=Gryllus bimaculatus nudivirus TaxID=432587 RepID=A4L205_9VIRU|nr:hypothetical protein GrBNV_gp42 [Gryllus bimaculatus nudivirus]ABO45375.1 unknown [Gryllus bimaculatus nudivirus]
MDNVKQIVTENDNTISIPLCYDKLQGTDIKTVSCYVTINNGAINLDKLEKEISSLLSEINETKDLYIKKIHTAETEFSKKIKLEESKDLMYNFSLLNKIIPNIKKLYECINDFFCLLENQALKIQEHILNYKNTTSQLNLISDTFNLQENDNIKNVKKYQALVKRLIAIKTKLINTEIKINNAIFKYNSLIVPLKNGILTCEDRTVNIRVLLNDMFDSTSNNSYLYTKFNDIASKILEKGFYLQISGKPVKEIIPIPSAETILNKNPIDEQQSQDQTMSQDQQTNENQQQSINIDGLENLSSDTPDGTVIRELTYLVNNRAYEGRSADQINALYERGKQSSNQLTKNIVEEAYKKKKTPSEILEIYQIIPNTQKELEIYRVQLYNIVGNITRTNVIRQLLKNLLKVYDDTLKVYRNEESSE